jgi:hypothetical protein
MAIETDTLTPPDIYQYVRDESVTLAEGYRDRSFPCGEGLGVLACAVAVVDEDVASGRRFVAGQLELIDKARLPAYDEADAWRYLARYGDEQARDTAWGILNGAVSKVKQSHEENGSHDGNARYLSEQVAERAFWLIEECDDRPESLEKARDAAKLAAETGTPRFLASLYERGDQVSFDDELSIFDAAVANATDETTGRHIRFLHDMTLFRLGVEAVAHDRFDQADEVLARLTDDHTKALVYAALLGKGRTEGLPFIEEFVGRDELRGGWKPVITRALAEAGYQPAIDLLRNSTDSDIVGYEEQRLYARLSAGIEGAHEAILAYIEARGDKGYGLFVQLCELADHGLEDEALEIAKARYEQDAEPLSAYWIWMSSETPDLAMWQKAYAGAKERKGGDLAAPARALYRLARLATHETTVS